MENLNINDLLNRNEEVIKIKDILKDFELNKNNLSTKRCLLSAESLSDKMSSKHDHSTAQLKRELQD